MICGSTHSGTTGLQDYYTGIGSDVFYLNNFDSISQSYGKSPSLLYVYSDTYC